MNGDEHVKQAYESILQGDYEQAIRCFEQAIDAHPDNPAYHYKCSITCARSAKWAKAMVHAEEAERLDPDNAVYGYHLRTVKARTLIAEAEATLASDSPDFLAAIEALREATGLDPLSDAAFLMLSAAYGALGRYGEAAASAEEALKLNPQHAEAARLLAGVRRKWRKERRHSGGKSRG